MLIPSDREGYNFVCMGKIYYCFIFVFLAFSVRVSAQSYNWSLSHGGSNTLGTPDEIMDVATDANGNTFVVASYGATMAITGGTPASATYSGQQDVFIAKYNSSGTIQWYKRLGAAQLDKGVSIIANPSGSGEVYVSGIIQANQYFHLTSAPFIYLPAANPSTRASEMFVARYNSTSGNCEWVRGIGADGATDAPAALEFDNLGNICVTGYIGASANIYDQRTGAGAPVTLAGSSPLPFNAIFDIAIVKLTTAGAFVSSQVIGGTGTDQPTAMHFDASGNMYLAGVFGGTLNLNPLGTTFNVVESAPQGSGDAFLAKYNSSGILLWAGTLRGVNQEFIKDIGLDGSGNVYITGSFAGFENFDLLGGTQTLTATGPADIFIASYDAADGSFNFANKIGGASGNNGGTALHVLSSGDHYVSGYFSGASVDFDPSAGTRNLSSAGNRDAFLAKYSSTGANTWAVNIGGANDDVANSVSLTSDSKIVWGGSFNGSGIDVDPGAGTAALTHVANEDMFLISYSECVGAAITAQPAVSQSICTGQNATFTVVASGTGLTYQWKKGGVNLTDGGTISGATSATLTITGLVSGDAATYTVDVIGCTGTVTSNNAVLTVPSGASITGQPAATQTLCTGTAASMTVTASGSGLTYQWKKGGVNVTNGGTITGATSATLNISSLVSGDAATYTVEVTATGCGAPLTSSNSVLVVNSAPAITAQPVTTQTLCAGSAAAFSVTATGAGLTYQWKKAGVDVTDGGTISGATTATLDISSIVAGDAASYTVVVTGTCGSPVTSSASALVVNTGAAISVQPAATQTLCTGNAASFSVTASGSGLTYQWKKGGVDVTDGGSISGATTAALNISSL
ncbi:MAG: large protein [Cytophagaceae bacterium]|nr:large protein [Cytophagaceae bacterium]